MKEILLEVIVKCIAFLRSDVNSNFKNDIIKRNNHKY